MSELQQPVEGWYDDPDIALRLRWWDGTRWTNHTRPKPVIDDTPEDLTPDPLVAEPLVAMPYGFSAPASFSPGSAPMTFSPGSAPEALGSYGSRTRNPDELWNTSIGSIEYAPERSTTLAAWALAVTPVVTVIAQAAAVVLTGFESTPIIWIIGATIIPVLWIIMWVRRDRITLHEWGHLRRAHWGWAFLGALGYLTARTIVVLRQTGGRGWWPLLLNLALTAVLVNVGLFTPVYDLVRDAIL